MRKGVCLDCAAALHVDEHTGELVDQWGEPICGASYRPHQPDVPSIPNCPVPTRRTTGANAIASAGDRRTERGGPIPPERGRGLPAPTAPSQGRFAPPSAVHPAGGSLTSRTPRRR